MIIVSPWNVFYIVACNDFKSIHATYFSSIHATSDIITCNVLVFIYMNRQLIVFDYMKYQTTNNMCSYTSNADEPCLRGLLRDVLLVFFLLPLLTVFFCACSACV